VRRVVAIVTASTLALLSSSGFAHAAPPSADLAEVAIGTFLVALGVMAFLGLVYLAKSWLGLIKLPPPEDPDAGGHH